MPDYITLPEQRVPVVAECDVLVVGGGAAGIAAAIAARRQGADVVLVERYGYLGGLASGGLIVLLLTLDDGDGHQVVAGLCQELVERLRARDACFFPSKDEWGNYDEALVEKYRRWGLVWGSGPHRVRYSVAYDPEEFKFIANTWVAEAGVRLMYHRWASADRHLTHNAEPRTHHADPRRLHLEGRLPGRARVVRHRRDRRRRRLRDGRRGVRQGADPPVALVPHVGRPRRRRGAVGGRGGFFFRTVKPGQVLMPWGAAERIERRIDATDPDDLTFAEVECRRMVMDEVDRLRAQVPGFEDAHLTDVALTLGVTESRRLQGAYTLARDDVGTRVRRHDRDDRPLDEVRRRLPHPVPQPAAAARVEPARRRTLHQRRPSRAPRDEGDPARVRHRRSRRHRRHARAPRLIVGAGCGCGVGAGVVAEGGGVVARMTLVARRESDRVSSRRLNERCNLVLGRTHRNGPNHHSGRG